MKHRMEKIYEYYVNLCITQESVEESSE